MRVFVWVYDQMCTRTAIIWKSIFKSCACCWWHLVLILSAQTLILSGLLCFNWGHLNTFKCTLVFGLQSCECRMQRQVFFLHHWECNQASLASSHPSDCVRSSWSVFYSLIACEKFISPPTHIQISVAACQKDLFWVSPFVSLAANAGGQGGVGVSALERLELAYLLSLLSLKE